MTVAALIGALGGQVQLSGTRGELEQTTGAYRDLAWTAAQLDKERHHCREVIALMAGRSAEPEMDAALEENLILDELEEEPYSWAPEAQRIIEDRR